MKSIEEMNVEELRKALKIEQIKSRILGRELVNKKNELKNVYAELRKIVNCI